MIKCGPQLSNAVQLDISELSGELLSKGLITSANRSNLNNPMIGVGHRASELVSMIRTRVDLDAMNFHYFIETLLMRVDDHRDILKILDEGYKSNGMTVCNMYYTSNVLLVPFSFGTHSGCLCSVTFFFKHCLRILVIIVHPSVIKKLLLLCRRTKGHRHCCCASITQPNKG